MHKISKLWNEMKQWHHISKELEAEIRNMQEWVVFRDSINNVSLIEMLKLIILNPSINF